MLKFIILTIALATAYAAPTSSPSGGKADSSPKDDILENRNQPPALQQSLASATASTLPPGRSPASSGKALTTLTEIKTPASTTKLAHLVAPLATPLAAAPILSPLQYAYAVPALTSFELAPAPSTYSIEQHGYRIIY